LLVIGFSFFYTTVVFQQQDLPGTLQRQGGFVPASVPASDTDYLNMSLCASPGPAPSSGLVAILPFLAQQITNVQVLQLSSTGLLIVVAWCWTP
jgi:preprotein translocase subunit SecY